MKKSLLTFFSLLLMIGFCQGQSFADDFESYNVGDFLAASSPEWTTWTNDPGGSEDVQITDENAQSGDKSIKFVAQGTGGPADVVLFFGGNKITSGFLEVDMGLFVESGAYFNFQSETTIGVTWSMNCFFEANGNGRITDGSSNSIFTFRYPENQWFDFEMDINFDLNKWQVTIDGECLGSFSNNNNAISSIDLYPVSGNSFFVDDFGYSYSEDAPTVTEDLKAVLTTTTENGLAGEKTELAAEITNGGQTVITSFEGELTSGADVQPFSADGLSIANGETVKVVLDPEYIMPDGFLEVSMSVTDINEGTFDDEDVCNNTSRVFLYGIVPAEHKKVVVEEGTGTWCGWCPRGAVWLENLTYKYPNHFIGIAVHNGDPMVVADYDGNLGAPAYPTATVNRVSFMDPSEIEPPFLQRVQEDPLATLLNGADWNEDTRELRISVDVTSLGGLSDGEKLVVTLLEDGVTGTGSGYAQSNFYSGSQDLIALDGTNYRDLPSPIPAADMVYDHVARALLTPFRGLEDSFDAGMEDGETKVFNFTYTVPEEFDITQMHIVSMISKANTTLDNAEQSSIDEAIANGFNEVSSSHDVALENAISIYPNPFSNLSNINVTLSGRTDITIEVLDMSGQLISKKVYPNQNGLFRTVLDANGLANGMYIVKITTGDKYATQRISIVK